VASINRNEGLKEVLFSIKMNDQKICFYIKLKAECTKLKANILTINTI